MLRCQCGKEIKDWRGARGHVQFSGGVHGDKQEVPDDWKDLFTEVDQSDDEPDTQTDDDGSQQASQQADDDTDDQPDAEPDEADSGQSEATERSRLKIALFDDFRALWGGHK